MGHFPLLITRGYHFYGWYKHARCSPDVAPRLTSGGYEEKVDGITPINILFMGLRGWRILIPYADKVDVITPTKILFIEGGKFCHRGWRFLIPHEDIVDVITPINILFIEGGEFCHRGWRFLIPHEDNS